MFDKSRTCNYQTQLFTIVLIIIAVVENGVGTIAIFLSNILLLMNYEGSAEKFSYRFFFSIFILVPSVTANIEMTPSCDITQVKYPGVGGVSKMSDT